MKLSVACHYRVAFISRSLLFSSSVDPLCRRVLTNCYTRVECQFPRQRNPLYRAVPLRIICPPTRKEKVLSAPFSARRSDAGRRAPYPRSFVPLMSNRLFPRRAVQSESDLYKQIRGGYCFILIKHNLQTCAALFAREVFRPRFLTTSRSVFYCTRIFPFTRSNR